MFAGCKAFPFRFCQISSRTPCAIAWECGEGELVKCHESMPNIAGEVSKRLKQLRTETIIVTWQAEVIATTYTINSTYLYCLSFFFKPQLEWHQETTNGQQQAPTSNHHVVRPYWAKTWAPDDSPEAALGGLVLRLEHVVHEPSRTILWGDMGWFLKLPCYCSRV